MTDCAVPVSPLSDSFAAAEQSDTSLKAWLAVFSVSLGAFASVTTEFIPVGLLPAVAKDLNVSLGTAGLMVTMPALAGMIAAPGVTVLSGRLDRRRLLWILTALLAVSNLLSAFAPNFAVMLIGRALLGISLGGFWSVAASLASRLVHERHASRALSIILAGISIATIVGVPMGVALSNWIGWRATFGTIGIVAVAVLIKQFLVLPPLPTTTAVTFSHLVGVFKSRTACVGFLAGAFVISGHFGAYTYVTPFLQQVAKVSPSMLSAVLLGYGLTGLAGNLLAGFTTNKHLRLTFMTVTALMAISALLLPIVGRTPGGAAVVLLLWGLGFGALPMCVQLWAFKSAPEAAESASAMLVTTFQICIATGAAWGGRVVDHFGTPHVMIIGGVIAGLGLLVLLLGGPAPTGAVAGGQMAH